MLTRLLENIDPLADDQAIVHKLDLGTHSDGFGGGACPIGIRNANGHIYRLVQVQGVGETVRLIRAMQMLGFTEEDHEAPDQGCHATFRRRQKSSH